MKIQNRISIVIVNYNGGIGILCCLDSLKQNTIDTEIIVVDNASKDGSPRKIENQYPWVKLILNQNNDGFGRAVNIGVSYATGEYIFILNPDTIVQAETLKILKDTYESFGQRIILGPKILNTNGTRQQSARSFPSFITAFFNRNSFLTNFFPKNSFSKKYLSPVTEAMKIQRVDWISGAAMFMKTATFHNLGGFDERFFMYCEDVDLCKRAAQFGVRTFFEPKSVIYHTSGGCSKTVKQRLIWYHHQSMWRYYLKHYKNNSLIDCFIFVGVILRALLKTALQYVHETSTWPSKIKTRLRSVLTRYVVLYKRRCLNLKINPKRILCLRTDHLGDVLLTLNAVELLKMQYPQADIHFYGRKSWRDLVLATGLITQYLNQEEFKKRWLLWNFLRKQKYDIAIDFGQRNTLKDAITLWGARIGKRIGYHTSYTGLFYTRSLRWDGRWRHETKMTSRLLRLLHREFLQKGLQKKYFYFSKSIGGVSFIEPKSYILLHPFAVSSNGLKEWPLNNFIELANLLDSCGERVVIVGSVSDGERGSQILHNLNPRVHNYIGKSSIIDLALLVKNAKYIVANNSGVYQLAMTMQTPCTLINGPSNLTRWGPLASTTTQVVQTEALACHGRDCITCLRGDHACMKFLSVDAVFEAIGKKLHIIREGNLKEI